MSEATSSTPTLTTALTAVAATAGVAIVLRAIKRHFSPTISSKLQCKCGKIQGHVHAKYEDSARIYCYCQDCRDYANYIASLGGNKDETIGKEFGDNRVVQFCKNAITIEQGQEHLKLAIKKKEPNSKQVYMHRYYAGCCHVPLMNTVDFLGFVGVFCDFLDEKAVEQWDGPCRMFQDEGLGQPNPPFPDASPAPFIWKLIRYLPWRKSGPFDYDLTPVYWGDDSNGEKKEEKKKDE
ncbi:expressed unknown protein [Seminavis robusta]|uniref:Uncharacterized protein n=1 Tax=Seminavis robusta TaxID=568900 RepID=A0A9N8DRI2_9STRA|nr:expressed unknown protein [Seminavis robusta]|eukprot:Sro300_g111680.1 n/a (237) ;mRNA; r:21948-22658